MKSTLEFQSLPAVFKPALAAQLGVVKTEHGIVPKRLLVSICAWCDPDKTLAQSLTKAGYKLTHGVCEKHKAEFIKKMNHQ